MRYEASGKAEAGASAGEGGWTGSLVGANTGAGALAGCPNPSFAMHDQLITSRAKFRTADRQGRYITPRADGPALASLCEV